MLTRIVGHHVQIFKVGEATLDLPTYTTACQSHDECRDSEWDRIPTQRQHTMKKIFRQPTGEYCTLSKRCSRKKVNTFEKSLSFSLFCDKAIKWFSISFFLPQNMFPLRMRKGRKTNVQQFVFFFICLPRMGIRGALRMRSALPRSVSSPAALFWRQG